MKHTSSFLSLAAVACLSALPAAAQDWSGFYGGAALSSVSGNWQHMDTPSGPITNFGDYSSAGMVSLFAGYNVQSGNLVYGGEFSAGRASDLCFEDYPGECADKFMDLKGRLGYAFGQALVYGVAGLTQLEYDYAPPAYTLTGVNYGLGVDYRVSDSYFVGGEILHRNTESDEFQGDVTEHSFTSVSLRFGMQF